MGASETLFLELRKEIDKLRNENSELKHHIYLCHPEVVVPSLTFPRLVFPPGDIPPRGTGSRSKDKATSTKDFKYSGCSGCTKLKEERALLVHHLHSGEKLLEALRRKDELKEGRMALQQLQIHELQRELASFHLPSSSEILQFQIPGGVAVTQTTPTLPKRGQPRPLPMNMNMQINRRPSRQSLLPTDYKESVSTLPPISQEELLKKLGKVKVKVRGKVTTPTKKVNPERGQGLVSLLQDS